MGKNNRWGEKAEENSYFFILNEPGMGSSPLVTYEQSISL